MYTHWEEMGRGFLVNLFLEQFVTVSLGASLFTIWTSKLERDWGFLRLSLILQILTKHLCSKQCHRHRGCGGKIPDLQEFAVEDRSCPCSTTGSHPPFVTITNLLIFKCWCGDKVADKYPSAWKS